MKLTKKLLPFEKFKEVCGLVPRLCVDVVIKGEKGIWLTKRAVEPYIGLWHVPGGSVLFGETVEEAVKRVAKEETGWEVEIVKLLTPVYYPNEERVRGYPMWIVSLAHEVKIIGGELKLDKQSSEAREFSQLPEDIIPDQSKWLLKWI